ncbi:Aspercryptin biosynthesis cluster-specific transcription regulator atnN [Colletotrichum sidae]|uniref:Aspercryptin biosynthesis cluster-specific transcription regulator atnN n=1 Tax=Colletotrichum sidae TaxID=1347389 RepID=A0A4R8TD74_9PEZI|nr:Aspercryptin biosynthesis cluster-specific transcription regulator atnN [Colletotrichum sidae]
MTSGKDLPPKRTRESTSKVRTGCTTCKARRVKCDESKPVCRRCTVGGRKCEYTTRGAPPPRNVITIYLPPTKSQPAFFVHNCGLDFFHQSIASMLDGQFDSRFWGHLVLQLSHSEPSVRHAVSAMSIIHRDVESSMRQTAGYVEANPDAQREWKTAVKSLSARIEAHPDSNLVPLVCCLLFTCIEFLRGNAESATLHARNGFNILASIHGKLDANQAHGISSLDLEAIEDCVVPMFSGLNVLCSLTGRIIQSEWAASTPEDSPHKDLNDSRRRFIEILDACVRLIREATPRAVRFQTLMDDLVEQRKLQLKLASWRARLDDLLERMEASGTPAKQDKLSLLLIQYKVAYIWIQVCTAPAETATDAYRADFEELVDHAEKVVKSAAKGSAPQPLSFEIHTMGPLYYAALKCRYPATRRRALAMLKLAPWREGFWNAHHAYATAKRVIELEESKLNEQGLPDETSRVHGLPLPDDESRVYRMGEVPLDFESSGHSVVPSPAYPGTLAAIFHMKPWGMLGEWHIYTEYIEL